MNAWLPNPLLALVASLGIVSFLPVPTHAANEPPKGFVALFNGKDLSGWEGMIAGGKPQEMLKLSPKDRAAAQAKADANLRKHWKVENGYIVNPTGKGTYLCTTKQYGDFELLMDWWIGPGADSGVYLRGTPQVQIWDPVNGIPAAKIGSGGLYNNKKGPSGPLVNADRPAGEWNQFRIVLIEDIVSIWLNDQLVVNNVPLENYWDRSQPLQPIGPIQLQTHGGELRFRNVFLREIERRPPESGRLDNKGNAVGDGWVDVLATSDWQMEPEFWKLEDGVLTGTMPGDPKHHHAYTQREYGDFELHAKVKMTGTNANSGVCVRLKPTSFDDAPGYQIDMGDGYWGALWEERRDGMVSAYPKEAAAKIVKADDWNHYYVLARGPHLQAWLNGVLTIDVVHTRGHQRGALGFQLAHGENRDFVAQFKDVVIRELTDDSTLRFTPPPKEADFEYVFNGENLDGWKGSVNGYHAENGLLVCKKGGNLYIDREFQDFVFRFEFRFEAGANNGVGIRCVPNTDAAYNGMEIQLLENTHHSYAKLAPWQYHGSVYGVAPAKRGAQRPVGYWNYEEITAKGDRITVKLNGETIVDVDLSEATKNGTVDGKKNHKFFPKGHIGFLGHGHRIEFRNIRIKELE